MQAVIFIINETAFVSDTPIAKKSAMMSYLTVHGDTFADHVDNSNSGRRSYALLCARNSSQEQFNIPLALATLTPISEKVDDRTVATAIDFSNIKLNPEYSTHKLLPTFINNTITQIQQSLKRAGMPPLAYAQMCISQDSKIADTIEQEGFAPAAMTTKYHVRPDIVMIKPTNLTPEQQIDYDNKLALASTMEQTKTLAIIAKEQSISNCAGKGYTAPVPC